MSIRLKDTFLPFIDYLQKSKRAPKTIYNYKIFFDGAFTHSGLLDKRINALRLTDVASVIESGSIHGEYGAHRAVSVFRILCKFLHLQGYKLAFDYRDIELPKFPRHIQEAFNVEELNQVLDNFDLEYNRSYPYRTMMNYSMKALCETLFSTGARISEALSLRLDQWEDIQKNKYTIIVGKGNQEGIIYFTDRAIHWIKKYLEYRNNYIGDKIQYGSLFINTFGKPLTPITAKSFIQRYRLQFSFAHKIKFHTFRRTLATMLIYNNADIKSVQTILRHSSERTTLRYYVIANEKQVKETHTNIVNSLLAGV